MTVFLIPSSKMTCPWWLNGWAWNPTDLRSGSSTIDTEDQAAQQLADVDQVELGLTLEQGINFIEQVVAVGRNAVERCEALADGERNVPRATGPVEAQGTFLVLIPWRWASSRRPSWMAASSGSGSQISRCCCAGSLGRSGHGAVDPMPLPPGRLSGAASMAHRREVWRSAPVIELVASGWVAVAELEQQMQRLRRRRLVGAPVAKGWLAVPELFELLEAQFDHLAGFGGA